MQDSNSHKTRRSPQSSPRLLMMVPLEEHFLPVESPPLVTTGLWQRIFAPGGREQYQERVDILCFYALFTLLRVAGSARQNRDLTDTLLMPVVFDEDRFSVRLTVQRRQDERPVLTFSLPEELMPAKF